MVDPFMGSGSTIAAAEAIGYPCLGVERYSDYFELAQEAVPKLKELKLRDNSDASSSSGEQEQLDL